MSDSKDTLMLLFCISAKYFKNICSLNCCIFSIGNIEKMVLPLLTHTDTHRHPQTHTQFHVLVIFKTNYSTENKNPENTTIIKIL